MIKLLWEDVDQEPILFLEPVYPRVHVPKQYAESLYALARAKALQLGVPLYCGEPQGAMRLRNSHFLI